jgi:hypothetical protein
VVCFVPKGRQAVTVMTMRSATWALLLSACTTGISVPHPDGDGGTSTGGGSQSGTGGSGGGSGSTGGGAASSATYACDVGPIVNARCLDCHSSPPRFGAPMSLVTYADTQADSAQYPGQKIYQRMAARVADPRLPMPQPPNAPLTAEQIAAIQGWAGAGAPQGDATTCAVPDGGTGDAGVPDSGYFDTPGCDPGDTMLPVVAPMTDIPQQSDYYECFAQTVSLPAKRHAIKIDKVIDNAQVLHHVVLFRDTAKSSPAVQLGCGIHTTWQALYAWGPGAGPMIPPPDVGLPINDGDQLVIQIHYNNPTSVMGKDSSGAYLCLTDQLRANEAGVLAIGPTQFHLPPNCPAVSVQGTCNNFLNTTYNVFTVWPHMHVRGRAMLTTLQHAGSADQVVTDRPNYYFGSQTLETANFQFQHGDNLINKCTWDTTGASGPVSFGEATSDEMCFNFLYLYPPPPVAFCPETSSTPVCN